MARLTFSLVSPSGEVLPLSRDPHDGGAFGLLSGSSGLGLADRAVSLAPFGAEGGRVRSVRVPSRPGTLLVSVSGASEAEVAANIRQLGGVVRYVRGLPLPRLMAVADGVAYELPFVYESGGEKLEVPAEGGTVVVSLNVTFPSPFWTAVEPVQVTVTGDQEITGLLPYLSELNVMSSFASGSPVVHNPGDVDAYPVYRIVGPAESVAVAVDGVGWTLDGVDDGEVVIVDTRWNSVQLEGVPLPLGNVYDRLGPVPRFVPLRPGPNTLTVAMTGTELGTSLTCYFRPRLEVVL